MSSSALAQKMKRAARKRIEEHKCNQPTNNSKPMKDDQYYYNHGQTRDYEDRKESLRLDSYYQE